LLTNGIEKNNLILAMIYGMKLGLRPVYVTRGIRWYGHPCLVSIFVAMGK